jgi:hypothetical protein
MHFKAPPCGDREVSLTPLIKPISVQDRLAGRYARRPRRGWFPWWNQVARPGNVSGLGEKAWFKHKGSTVHHERQNSRSLGLALTAVQRQGYLCAFPGGTTPKGR